MKLLVVHSEHSKGLALLQNHQLRDGLAQVGTRFLQSGGG